MFATLDPTSRRLRLPIDQEIVINDTVGFIRDLPETLVAAFRATLEEISESDLLLHVVDASGSQCQAQIESVEKILTDLELNEIPRIVVLNKMDLTEEAVIDSLKRSIEIEKGIPCLAISAIQTKSLSDLFDAVGGHLMKDLSEIPERHLVAWPI